MINKKKIYFVPGYTGLDEGSWPVWLSEEFPQYGFDFNILSMPDPMYPEVNEWLSFLHNQNIEVDENTYFIGHSLGCITIARYLEKLPKGSIAAGCIFVSGFCRLPDVPLLSKFCSLPLDFSEVKKHSQEFVVVTSDNDHIIPRVYSEEFAGMIGARVILENKGHFKFGVKKLPSVLNVILEMDIAREKMQKRK